LSFVGQEVNARLWICGYEECLPCYENTSRVFKGLAHTVTVPIHSYANCMVSQIKYWNRTTENRLTSHYLLLKIRNLELSIYIYYMHYGSTDFIYEEMHTRWKTHTVLNLY
jgi:hypothetical protein